MTITKEKNNAGKGDRKCGGGDGKFVVLEKGLYLKRLSKNFY